MQITAPSNLVVRSTQTQQPAPPAPPAAEQAPAENFTPSKPEKEAPKKPTWQRVLVHTAIGAASGAMYGNWLNGSFSRNVALNVGLAAGGGALICGALGAGAGALEGGKAGQYFLLGAGVGAAGGAVLGLAEASIDHLVRSMMPFSPAINGAILGGISGALSTPAESLFDQIRELKNQKDADKPKG